MNNKKVALTRFKVLAEGSAVVFQPPFLDKDKVIRPTLADVKFDGTVSPTQYSNLALKDEEGSKELLYAGDFPEYDLSHQNAFWFKNGVFAIIKYGDYRLYLRVRGYAVAGLLDSKGALHKTYAEDDIQDEFAKLAEDKDLKDGTRIYVDAPDRSYADVYTVNIASMPDFEWMVKNPYGVDITPLMPEETFSTVSEAMLALELLLPEIDYVEYCQESEHHQKFQPRYYSVSNDGDVGIYDAMRETLNRILVQQMVSVSTEPVRVSDADSLDAAVEEAGRLNQAWLADLKTRDYAYTDEELYGLD